jgi:hypothetical protein
MRTYVRHGVAAIAALALTGCPNYLFVEKLPASTCERHIVTPAAKPAPADILFVVDDSCSMDNKQMNLEQNFHTFIQNISSGVGDYQIAVVSTNMDMNNFPMGEVGGQTNATYEGAPYFYLTSLDSNACHTVGIQHGCFRGPDPGSRIVTSALPADQQVSKFQANVAVGSCGSGIETGLSAMQSAIQQANQGGCNQGFLRPDANLVIIVLSDEDDTDATPVDQYVNNLIGMKPASKIRIAMITASEDGKAVSCSNQQMDQCGAMACGPGAMPVQPQRGNTPPPMNDPQKLSDWQGWCNWCSFFNSPDCCTALVNNHPQLGEGGRYVKFALQMEQRIAMAANLPVANCRPAMGTAAACLVDSICQDNYSNTLARIATELVVSDTYSLNPPAPYGQGVAVKITGGRFGSGQDLVNGKDFSVSTDGATLRITNSMFVPQPMETVNIYYIEGCM